MTEVGEDQFASYQARLEREPDEYGELFNTILINVTQFMRDPAAWEYVSESVLPRIVEDKSSGEPIRVWSAGCASGEETYSIAVLLAEHLGEDRFRRDVKIYGSDLDDDAVVQARLARYSLKALQNGLTPEQIDRYFERTDGGLQFRKDLRRSVIFGRHDLVKDPPISRVDLLLCRNTLMYFNADLQRKILSSFNFALNDGGYLFLGKSEALVTRTKLFSVDDMKHHVFVKGKRQRRPRASTLPPPAVGPPSAANAIRGDHLVETAVESLPTAIMVVDRFGALALANRRARTLFGIPSNQIGQPFHELEMSYRPIELRSPIEQVLRERRASTLEPIEVVISGAVQVLEAHLQPFGSDPVPLGVVMAFAEVGPFKQLEHELERSRHDLDTAYEELQSTVEELETTNEELQSTNEELETTNEELHSTNEELETMNEELQSTNEELETINTEFGRRTDELDNANAYLNAILGGLGSAIVVLDSQMAVRIWNTQAEELWGLRSDEVEGQHFLNLDIGLPIDELRNPIREVQAADDRSPVDLVVDAVNRRGKAFRCHVLIAHLVLADDRQQGLIVRMEPALTG
jgi:two-component system CheB/CheR fusion protein